eukprot:scaffold624_cov402-Prasinococcus_capsulatus_cf.AAC.66
MLQTPIASPRTEGLRRRRECTYTGGVRLVRQTGDGQARRLLGRAGAGPRERTRPPRRGRARRPRRTYDWRQLTPSCCQRRGAGREVCARQDSPAPPLPWSQRGGGRGGPFVPPRLKGVGLAPLWDTSRRGPAREPRRPPGHTPSWLDARGLFPRPIPALKCGG